MGPPRVLYRILTLAVLATWATRTLRLKEVVEGGRRPLKVPHTSWRVTYLTEGTR